MWMVLKKIKAVEIISFDCKGQLHTRIQLQVNGQTETRKKISMSLTQTNAM